MHGTVVLATSNHATSIRPVFAEIDEAAATLARAGIDLAVLVVDDDSTDGTPELARREAQRFALAAEVISGPSRRPGAASLTAFRHLLARDDVDVIVTLDAGGHHDARQITDLLRRHLARGNGLTIGSRWVRGGSAPGSSRARALASRSANALVRTVSGLRHVHDSTTSFWVVDPEVARTVLEHGLDVDGYGFFPAFVALSQAFGYTIDEVPITYRPRYSDVEALSLRDVGDFARSLRPLRDRVAEVRAKVRADQPAWAARSGRLRRQAATSGSSFGAAAELERLAGAERFTSWIADEIAPQLGSRILEVGAGIGTMTLALAARRPESSIMALEPAGDLLRQLQAATSEHPRITAAGATTAELLADGSAAMFDSVVYVNVLEHILDDDGELRAAHRLLRPGGTLALFVPALPGLYGSLDYKSGHHRRYRRDELAGLLAAGGFTPVDVRYVDPLGVLPYYAMYRVLDVASLGEVSTAGYDRVVVPLGRRLQRVVPNPPFGKNLLAIARAG